MTHRLGEADDMRPEHANNAEIEFYTPDELRALLEAAEGPVRAIMALAGLVGLRTQELLRLDWMDVWRVRGHIEVTAGKAKTRQRRLVEIVPALAAWLVQFRGFTSGKVCTLHEVTWQQHFVELCEKAGVSRKSNGLRHGFCTYHFAAHGNENLTAQQAGNSPGMLHQNYKGLATREEGQAWFAWPPRKPRTLSPCPPPHARKRIDRQSRVKHNTLVKHENSQCQTTPTRLWRRDGLGNRRPAGENRQKGQGHRALVPAATRPAEKSQTT